MFLSRNPVRMFARKAGVASEEQMSKFLAQHAEKVIVVDARNPDFSVEPEDEGTVGIGPIAGSSASNRPKAVNLVFDRKNGTMPVDNIPPGWMVDGKDTPIITHCGGGGRGQKARVLLESQGFTNVINGGGPKDTELWKMFGHM